MAGSAAVVFVLAAATPARAQTFQWQAQSGNENVPFVLATYNQGLDAMGAEISEFTRDAFGDHTPSAPPGTPPQVTGRVAARLRERFRVVGNPYVRSATLRFDWFDMDSFPEGGVVDRAEMQWFYSSPVSLTGRPASGAIHVAATGSNTLMWPGMIFHTITGPDFAMSQPAGTDDRESWGYRTQDIQVWGNATIGDFVPPTLGVYDQALAVLLEGDDTVDVLVANTGHPVTVSVWPQSGTSSGLGVWGRCGALNLPRFR